MSVTPAVQAHRAEVNHTTVTVHFPSTVNLQSANTLRCGMLDALRDRPTRLLVDMSEVDDVDVTAVAILIGVCRRLRRLGGRLELVNINARPALQLHQLGLSQLLCR